MAAITEFETWSNTNLTAIGCSVALVAVLAIALLINFKYPRKNINDEVDGKLMRGSGRRKKRTESVRDFLHAVKVIEEKG